VSDYYTPSGSRKSKKDKKRKRMYRVYKRGGFGRTENV